MKRILSAAAAVWLAVAGFAALYRAFEIRVLEASLGPEATELLGASTLAGAVFLAALVWLGTREAAVSWREAGMVSIVWLIGAAGLSLAASGRSFSPGPAELAATVSASFVSPWLVWLLRATAPRRLRAP